MISVIQNGQQYEIRFRYDPELIDLVKNVPGRRWEPEIKAWVIPLARLGFFLAQVKGTKYESHVMIQSDESINVNASIDEPNKIPDIDISEYHYQVKEGLTPYKHQLDSLKFAKWRYENGLRSGFFLADEPGAAKTCQTYNIAQYMRQFHGCKHCLIIACVNAAKYNWKEDIEKHSNGSEHPYILGTRKKRNGDLRFDTGGKEKLEDLMSMKMYGKEDEDLPYFIILNIEAVRTKSGKKYPVADRLIELINCGEIGIIALDEIHRNCSMSSMQGQQLLRIKTSVKQEVQWIPITGTPITSKPTDVFLPTRLIDAHSSNSYYMWCQHYCIYGGFGGHEIIGYKNIPELKQILQPNMLRRLKKDILDLPPKIHFTEYIENSPYQKKLYSKIADDLVSNRDQIVKMINPMSKLLRLRQVNGSPELVDMSVKIDNTYLSKNAKLSRLLELLDDILSIEGEKVIIFSNWVEPLRTLYRFIKSKYKVCCYTGTMSQEDREKHKKTFIENPNYRIMLGTVGALGPSHTLTVARNVIFYDSPWNPSDIEQCEDRVHRPGATNSVNIYTLVTKDTIDENVHSILSKKDGTAKYIVDNVLDLRSNPELFDFLLRR